MIVSVTISIDDNIPEYMIGIVRCGSVVSEDSNGNEIDHQELIDNTEYHSEKEMVFDIAKRLKIDSSIIEVI
jgi:hypothetical protein